jgi:hypothetical protein
MTIEGPILSQRGAKGWDGQVAVCLRSASGKVGGVLVFVFGKDAKQVAVGNGTEGFRAVAVVAQASGGKDQRPKLTVFGFQAFERGEGDAVSAVEVLEGFKEFGFALMVGAAALGL